MTLNSIEMFEGASNSECFLAPFCEFGNKQNSVKQCRDVRLLSLESNWEEGEYFGFHRTQET
jgi:hypothetical protein